MKVGYSVVAALLLAGCWSDNPRQTRNIDAGLGDIRVTGAFVSLGFEIGPRVCSDGDASAVCVSGGIVP